MANCQENACTNVRSAICLHCNHYLCITHIVEHGNLLLREGDELCEQINELAEHLNGCLLQIHVARDETIHKLHLWKQNQIDKIEHKYTEKIQTIQCQKDHLIYLENQLTERLIKEAKEPLESMQTRQNASSQSLQVIRQVIANILKDSAQLDLYVKDSSTQSATSSNINTTPIPISQNTSTITLNSLPNQTTTTTTTKQIVITPSVIPKPTTTTTTATSKSKPTIKRPPTNSCRPLIKLFNDVSGSSQCSIEIYINKNLHGVVHVNNMMILLLSFLEAWHSSKSVTILVHHIPIIKKYIKEPEHSLIVIAAIQVFVNSCNYDEKESSKLMTDLLRFFLNNQCISIEIIFDWYKNGLQYDYPAFSKAKLWAKPLIDELNTNIE